MIILQTGCSTNNVVTYNSEMSDKTEEFKETEIDKALDRVVPNSRIKPKPSLPLKRIERDTGYVKINDYNTSSMDEVLLGYELEETEEVVVAEAEAFILLGYTYGEKDMDVNPYVNARKIAVVAKLDRTGKLLWKKEYNYITKHGNLSNLLTTIDGGFVFCIRNQQTNSFIVKCDADGNEIWRKPFRYSDMVQKLFINYKNEIFALGTGLILKAGESNKDKFGRYNPEDIIITKIDPLGNIIEQKKFGGSNSDRLKYFEYIDELGFVIIGDANSKNGDFAVELSFLGYKEFIACIDNNLEVKWVYQANGNEGFEPIRMDNKQIVIENYSHNDKGEIITKWLSFNEEGEKIWEKSELFEYKSGKAKCLLDNGNIATYTLDEGLRLIDMDGNILKENKDIELGSEACSSIRLTNDGGFIVSTLRFVSTIPQIEIMSHIWYDTETFLAKYDENLNLLWNKSYNKHKESTRNDFIYILNDDSILVEN